MKPTRPRFTPLFSSIRHSDKLAALPDDACRLFYLMLLAQCDAWGRHDARAKVLCADVWPLLDHDPKETERCRDACAKAGLILVLRDGDRMWIQVPDWEAKAGTIGKLDHRKQSEWPDTGQNWPGTGPAPSSYTACGPDLALARAGDLDLELEPEPETSSSSKTFAPAAANPVPAPQVLRESEAERPQQRNGDPAPERVGVRDGPGLWGPPPPSKRAEPIEVEAVPDDGSAEPAGAKRKRGGGGGNAMTRHWDAEWARLRPDHGPFAWTQAHAVALAKCAGNPGSSPEEVCRRITRILASQDPFHLRAATPCVLRQQWSNLPADIVRPMTERERILATPIPEYPYPPSRP